MLGRLWLAVSVLAVFASSTTHAACVSPAGVEGDVLYNQDYNVLQACDATDWHALGRIDLAAANGACANPAGSEADMLYNADYNVLQFCNGQDWIPMGASNPSAANGTCANPSGSEAAMVYNAYYHVLQFCNGQDWITLWHSPNWWWSGAALDLDFVNDRYRLNGVNYAGIANFIAAAGATFTRSGTATYFDANGVMQNAVANTPRLDHDPVTHEARGVLIEEARTNQQRYSTAFSSWLTKSNVTVTASASTAPNGTMTASLITATGAGLSYISDSTAASAGVTYTRSVYAKAGTSAEVIFEFLDNSVSTHTKFRLDTLAITSNAGGSAQIVSVGNGWFRLSATKTYTGAGINSVIYIDAYGTGGAGQNVYLWGAQLETGPVATSYIPTTSATVTRATDYFRIPTAGWFDATKGTFLGEAYGQINQAFGCCGRIAGGDYPISFVGYGSGGLNVTSSWNNSTVMSKTMSVTASPTQQVKMAFAWDSGPMTESITGTGLTPTTGGYSGSWASTYLGVGASINGANTFTPLNTSVRRISYFPVRQSDASLADYTR